MILTEAIDDIKECVEKFNLIAECLDELDHFRNDEAYQGEYVYALGKEQGIKQGVKDITEIIDRWSYGSDLRPSTLKQMINQYLADQEKGR